MSEMFFGGIPTAPDVKKLVEFFEPVEGMTITHEEIEAVIDVKHGTARYQCVTRAWRAQLLREDNIELGSVRGVGYQVLNPNERITASVNGFSSGTRKQLKSVHRASLVQTTDEKLLRKKILMQKTGTAIAAAASRMMRKIEPPSRPEPVPLLGNQ